MIRKPFPTGVHPYSRPPQQDDDKDSALARLWALRLLVVAGGYDRFIDSDGDLRDSSLAEWLGMGDTAPGRRGRHLAADGEDVAVWELDDDEEEKGEDEDDGFAERLDDADEGLEARGFVARSRDKRRRVLDQLHDCHQSAERDSATLTDSPILAKVEHLARLCGLPRAAAHVLAFVALTMDYRQELRSAADCLRPRSETEVAQALAATLQVSANEALAAIAADGALVRAGLLARQSMTTDLADWFSIDLSNLSSHLVDGEASMETWLEHVVHPSADVTVRSADYRHVGGIELAQVILARALEQRRQGVNVLLHGPAGAGKAELARLLARRLDASLFDVPASIAGQEPLTLMQRLKALHVAQRLLGGRPALLLLDDADDTCAGLGSCGVSGSAMLTFGRQRQGPLSLAGMRALLASTPTPTLWVAHDTSTWPVALVRHFDLVLEVAAPPREQMLEWLGEHAGGLVSRELAERLVELPGITPGVLTEAIGRARECTARPLPTPADAVVETLVRGMLKLPNVT